MDMAKVKRYIAQQERSGRELTLMARIAPA